MSQQAQDTKIKRKKRQLGPWAIADSMKSMRDRYWIERPGACEKSSSNQSRRKFAMDRNQSTQLLDEMKQFASFSAADQRFIRRSLDVGLKRTDAVECWARNPGEAALIEEQGRRYRIIDLVRACIPDDDSMEATECFLAPLITMSVADLAEAKLSGFESYRFLYERVVGPEVRPWLLSAFCAAAAMPSIHPELRKQLMESIPLQAVVTAGWSIRAPIFYPEWVEKVAEAVN
jgi:hypothetical protein